MGVLAEHGRLALGVWSPGGNGAGFLATGTYSSPVDSSFTSSPVLELLSVDVQRSKLTTASQLPTSDKFCSLHWGNPLRPHPAGLIAAGLADSTVCVWDAASVLRAPKSPDEKHALVYSSDSKHISSQANAIAFNPSVQQLLASGHADGQILVWDLSNPAAVSPRHPANKPSSNSSPADKVTALAWNHKVHNILSTSTVSGVMNVWDLKQSRQVISIRNPRGRLSCSSIAWHPDIATQIVITCDDDDSTGAVLWDLRNATAPIKTFSHHSPKGVVSASWSTFDTDLLLTSSKDMRTVVVSVSTGEVVVDSPQSSDWNFDVKWSPRVPGLYLASSHEGRLSVSSILSASSSPSVSSETASALAESFGETAGDFQSGMATQSPRTTESQRVVYNVRKPPKWLRRPSVVSFAFGGLTASVSAKQSPKVSIGTTAQAFPKFSNSMAKLDAILMDVNAEDPKPVIEWCKKQSEDASSQRDKLAWEVLSILFQTDSRRKVVEYLGFKPACCVAKENTTSTAYGLLYSNPISVPIKAMLQPSDMSQSGQVPEENIGPEMNGGVPNLDGSAPWELPEDQYAQSPPKGNILDGDDADNPGVDSKGPHKSDAETVENGLDVEGKSKEEVEELIKKQIVVGDFKSAVDICLRVGRIADALLLANAGGTELWNETQTSYLSRPDLPSSMKAVGAVLGVEGSLDTYVSRLIDTGEDSWKEALAVLLTYIPSDRLGPACCQLGDLLISKGIEIGAVACFLCAYDTSRIASTWRDVSPKEHSTTSGMLDDHLHSLGELVQRVRIITAAVLLAQGEREIGIVRALDSTSGSILCEFGALMALQGEYALAVTYLGNLDNSHACMYGTAEDLHAKASECLTSLDSGTVQQDFSGSNFNRYSVPQSNPYDSMPTTSYQNSWMSSSQQADPPVPSQMNTGYAQPPNAVGGPVGPPPPGSFVPPPQVPIPSMSQVSGTPVPPHPAPIAPPQPRTSHQTLDPSSAYAAPHVQHTYAPAPNATASARQPAPPPPTPFPSYSHGQMTINGNIGSGIPAPTISHIYGGQSAPMVPGSSTGTINAQLPPPPPPSGEEAPLPKSYHLKAKQGSGASLPPSSEVAVLKSRQAKETSSGLPKRNSSGSSLSASGTEVALLDKIDISKFGSTEASIIKSLRKLQTHAVGLNRSVMYRRKMDDINKRLGRLAADLGAGAIEDEVMRLLIEVTKSVDSGNYADANAGVASLIKRFWDSYRNWIQGLKFLFDCAQNGR